MVDCGLTNLASCLPEQFFQYILSLLNAPLQPLLDLTRSLLSEPVNLQLFSHLWIIIVSMLSFFYGFLIMYSGFSFIISGHDVQRRDEAKSWLRNTLIMIVLVQASFFIYLLANDLASVMTSATLTLVPQDFFLLTAGNVIGFTLQLTFGFVYLITILFTILMLIIRYAIVAIGAMLFPLAIFSYFIPILRHYGIMILNFLGTCLFVNFINAIILVGFSQLINIPLFENLKILVMISAFGLVNLVIFFLMFFSLIKGGVGAYAKVNSIITKL